MSSRNKTVVKESELEVLATRYQEDNQRLEDLLSEKERLIDELSKRVVPEESQAAMLAARYLQDNERLQEVLSEKERLIDELTEQVEETKSEEIPPSRYQEDNERLQDLLSEKERLLDELTQQIVAKDKQAEKLAARYEQDSKRLQELLSEKERLVDELRRHIVAEDEQAAAARSSLPGREQSSPGRSLRERTPPQGGVSSSGHEGERKQRCSPLATGKTTNVSKTFYRRKNALLMNSHRLTAKESEAEILAARYREDNERLQDPTFGERTPYRRTHTSYR